MFIIYKESNQDYYNNFFNLDYKRISDEIYLQLQQVKFKIITALDKDVEIVKLNLPGDFFTKEIDVSHICTDYIKHICSERNIKDENDLVLVISQYIVPDIVIEFNNKYENTDYYLEDILMLTRTELKEIVKKFVEGLLEESTFSPFFSVYHTNFMGYKVKYIPIHAHVNTVYKSYSIIGLASILGLDKKLDFFVDDH